MDKIFYPNSIAVIGVSERPNNMGRNIGANLLDFGYGGEIHVGRREGVVFGHRIRITITGADAGNFDTPVLDPAPTVTIYCNAEHASYIELPVIGEPPPHRMPTTGAVVEQPLEAGWGIVLFELTFLLTMGGFWR